MREEPWKYRNKEQKVETREEIFDVQIILAVTEIKI